MLEGIDYSFKCVVEAAPRKPSLNMIDSATDLRSLVSNRLVSFCDSEVRVVALNSCSKLSIVTMGTANQGGIRTP